MKKIKSNQRAHLSGWGAGNDDSGGESAGIGAGGIWELPISYVQLHCGPKTALKK